MRIHRRLAAVFAPAFAAATWCAPPASAQFPPQPALPPISCRSFAFEAGATPRNLCVATDGNRLQMSAGLGIPADKPAGCAVEAPHADGWRIADCDHVRVEFVQYPGGGVVAKSGYFQWLGAGASVTTPEHPFSMQTWWCARIYIPRTGWYEDVHCVDLWGNTNSGFSEGYGSTWAK